MDRLDRLFDAGQMVWPMPEIALGHRSLGYAVGIGRGKGITGGPGFCDGGLLAFEGQLAALP